VWGLERFIKLVIRKGEYQWREGGEDGSSQEQVPPRGLNTMGVLEFSALGRVLLP